MADIVEQNVRRMNKQWVSRESHPRWTREQGIAAFSATKTPASQKGWILSMGGTTLANEDGQDLDLVAYAWRDNASRTGLIGAFENELDVVVVDVYRSILGYIGVGMCDMDSGHLVDLTIIPGRMESGLGIMSEILNGG